MANRIRKVRLAVLDDRVLLSRVVMRNRWQTEFVLRFSRLRPKVSSTDPTPLILVQLPGDDEPR